jgi:hypothetical protein
VESMLTSIRLCAATRTVLSRPVSQSRAGEPRDLFRCEHEPNINRRRRAKAASRAVAPESGRRLDR